VDLGVLSSHFISSFCILCSKISCWRRIESVQYRVISWTYNIEEGTLLALEIEPLSKNLAFLEVSFDVAL
jgi:hypothetical protein